jgi:hypothetical protein
MDRYPKWEIVYDQNGFQADVIPKKRSWMKGVSGRESQGFEQ